MDEQVPGPITDGLRLRGIDVLTAQEDGRTSSPDEALLARAHQLERILFTQDRDFLKLVSACQANGQSFGGVVYVRQGAISIRESIDELEVIATCSEFGNWLDRIEYLPF